MTKIVELENVYLEYSDEFEKTSDEENSVIFENRTAKISLEELQKKLEETQALHL